MYSKQFKFKMKPYLNITLKHGDTVVVVMISTVETGWCVPRSVQIVPGYPGGVYGEADLQIYNPAPYSLNIVYSIYTVFTYIVYCKV